MLKFLQKSLPVLAIAGAGFAANAQDIKENFQSWTETNVKMNTGAPGGVTTAEDQYGTCDKDNSTGTESVGHGIATAPVLVTKTVAYGAVSVDYTVTTGAVVPKCRVKYAYNSASSPKDELHINPSASLGYIELQKSADATGATEGGMLEAHFAYVEAVDFSISSTNTAVNFNVATNEGGAGYIPNTANSYNTGSTGKGGAVFRVLIQKSNVTLKIASTNNIIRIHDINAYLTPQALSISGEAWYDMGAKVRSEGNTVYVTAARNGQAQIVNVNGVVVGETSLVAGIEGSINVPNSGMYVVRLAATDKTASKKIVVQ